MRQKQMYWWVGAVLLLAITVGADYMFSPYFSSALFYLWPVVGISWFIGPLAGTITAIVGAGLHYLAIAASSGAPPVPLLLWNVVVHLCLFLFLVYLLSALKHLQSTHASSISLDPLTGVMNARFFSERLQAEIDRCQRYQNVFSVAYIDLDNFNVVNDRWGHSVGDQVLRMVVTVLQQQIRKTDSICRLGGDEFALLLPETNPESSQNVLNKVSRSLRREMQHQEWPVTFSIGVVTCVKTPSTSDELISLADKTMYSVKHQGKDGINYTIYDGA